MIKKMTPQDLEARGITSDWLTGEPSEIIPREKEKPPKRDANDPSDPLPLEELTLEEAEERCEICEHKACEAYRPGGSPSGPGSYCDDPFTDLP